MILQTVKQALSDATSSQKIFLGFSGGLDSSVLLHALWQLDFKPTLIHINHGLSPQANDWALHAKTVAKQYQLPCEVFTLNDQPALGESIEAWAREARYKIFSSLIQKEDWLLLAHHLDDQAETFFLQLLRGAGPKGLSSMASHHPFGSGFLIRPLLSLSRKEIQAYADQQKLTWISDESNEQIKFKRNFLRHHIFPALKEHFPGCLSTIARSARLCADESEVLNELLQEKLPRLVEEQNPSVSRFYFKRDDFVTASEKLKRQLLRAWIFSVLSQGLNERHVDEIKKLLTAEHWGKSTVEVNSDGSRVIFSREKEVLKISSSRLHQT